MTDFYDPYAAQGDYEADYADNQWMNGISPMMLGDLSASGNAQSTDVATVNRQYTALKNFLALRANPYFNQMVAEMNPGSDVFDYSSFTPGGGVTGQNAGFDVGPGYMGGGMTMAGMGAAGGGSSGGGGAFGGKGNGWDPYYDTTELDSALQSDDPVVQQIAKDLSAGKDRASIKLKLRSTSQAQADPEILKVYNETVDNLAKVQIGKSKNDRMGADMQGGFSTDKAGPLAAYWARSGMPNPADRYDQSNLPAEVSAPVEDYIQNNPFFNKNTAPDIRTAQQLRKMIESYNKMPGELAFEAEPNTPGGKPGGIGTTAGAQVLNAAAATGGDRNWQGGGAGRRLPSLTAQSGFIGVPNADGWTTAAEPVDPAEGAMNPAVVSYYRKNPELIAEAKPEVQAALRKAIGAPTPVLATQAPTKAGVNPASNVASFGNNFSAAPWLAEGGGPAALTAPGIKPGPGVAPSDPAAGKRDLQQRAKALYAVARNRQGSQILGTQDILRQHAETQGKAQADMRRMAGEMVQKTGRTPGMDRIQAQMNALRQMGITL